MILDNIAGIAVWTATGALLLFLLMFVDSLFTGYNDIQEMRDGNVAVTTRFVMKLFSQGFILSSSIKVAYSLGEALFMSAVSFVILLILEFILRLLFRSVFAMNLEEGTKEGRMSYALVAGSMHIVGALIIAACL
ncbi:DUF350 domain-containing protein [Paenibacillus melissococcoides]|uniref:DUF350 domain-containing protein n=1 Tax=Paenibacillus melissococcoides TaxID=2912268 RepID=A0ABM9G4T9_9BACL|nr:MULTISPECIES: DUF350 domain-containing protein [Paenibacillus]MEB9892153.1 DUF350 domain-containing protein [Bacillus cereus]CAH8246765.1 DUF350 domain-containing protein [Paenibacillus melissococcoides]CAH8715688.1 DUF350 domain-containing protein [Paenibacillus melissococcoides]CAH8716646.1 DUF350 domain-containing protein [Paenibacillus melissococcoides]GIO77055.1 DUF350 domain-containing protein [Paenibacillus dendritiformis]